MNKIVCERILYTYKEDIKSDLNKSYWRDILNHNIINVADLIENENYIIVDVKTSSSAACSEQAGTKIFVDHTILTLQKE